MSDPTDPTADEKTVEFSRPEKTGGPPLDEAPTIAQHGTGDSGKAGGAVPMPTPPAAKPVSSSTGIQGPGSVIGPYFLEEQLGEGGFGVVYRAKQKQPIVREVALKIIKAGMDTKEVIARFEAERQALAIMDHPNIAKVLDAGTTEHGRPYFVMELVNGLPVNHYCDRHNLGTRQRLELFREICAAIQHAHQKGIIHRDLKPNNILVASNDDKPLVKVIDFGIAKALSQELTEKTLFTAQGQIIGTPQYMSPEQSEMNSFDIDTRSDIFSLGIVLYELLTGTTPLTQDELRRAGIEELCRLICEREPPLPSVQLNSLSLEDTACLAETHGSKPDQLAKSMRGDLDWIVMMALEKERDRRYQNVADFSADIGNFLSDQPVNASPPSRSYRLRKFARRNRTALSSVALIAVALIAGTVISIWQAVIASEQRELAEKSAEESAAILDFFENEILMAARPTTDGEGLGIDVTVLEALDAAESKIDSAFDEKPFVERSIRATLAGTYLEMGKTTKAIEQYENVVALLTQSYGNEAPETLAAKADLGRALAAAGRLDEALAVHEHVLQRLREELGDDQPETVEAMHHLASTYSALFRREDYLAMIELTVESSIKVHGEEAEATIRAKVDLASAYSMVGRYEDAEALYKNLLALFARTKVAEDVAFLVARSGLAQLYGDTGRIEEAITMTEELLALDRSLLGPHHPKTLQSLTSLSILQRDAGLSEDAYSTLQELIRLNRKVYGPNHRHTLGSIGTLGYNYYDRKKWPEAEAQFREVIGLMEVHEPTWWVLPYTKSVLGKLLIRRKAYPEAETVLLESVEGLKATPPENPEVLGDYVGSAIATLIDLYRAWDQPDELARWQAILEETSAEQTDAPQPPEDPTISSQATVPVPLISIPTTTREQPFENSLGMKFVPVAITGGPSDGKVLLFSIWETRVKDFETFAQEDSNQELTAPEFPQDDMHPAVNVTWDAAIAFCHWLTESEQAKQMLGQEMIYRLPTDHEWSNAVGIADLETADATILKKRSQHPETFPWGGSYPPTAKAGNYYGEETKDNPFRKDRPSLAGYDDGFDRTAPVASFQPNEFGLYDIGGNAWEWCQDWYDPEARKRRAFRGGSWLDSTAMSMRSSMRGGMPQPHGSPAGGFRIVLDSE